MSAADQAPKNERGLPESRCGFANDREHAPHEMTLTGHWPPDGPHAWCVGGSPREHVSKPQAPEQEREALALAEDIWQDEPSEAELDLARCAIAAGWRRPAPEQEAVSDEAVARALMGVMGCEVHRDQGECPSCDGSIPCRHPWFTYCTEHDDDEDDLGPDGTDLCQRALRYARALTANLPHLTRSPAEVERG